MGNLHYRRHFSMLAAAAVILYLVSRWDVVAESLVAKFAVGGALHAAALVLALRTPQVLVRKMLFMSLAAALSILTLYIGIVGLQLFAELPAAERLYLVLGVCAAAGAISYGSLVRLFWMPAYSPRRVLATAALCASATLFAFVARSYVQLLGGWWLTAAWWFAFSAGLWYFDARNGNLRHAKRYTA